MLLNHLIYLYWWWNYTDHTRNLSMVNNGLGSWKLESDDENSKTASDDGLLCMAY